MQFQPRDIEISTNSSRLRLLKGGRAGGGAWGGKGGGGGGGGYSNYHRESGPICEDASYSECGWLFIVFASMILLVCCACCVSRTCHSAQTPTFGKDSKPRSDVAFYGEVSKARNRAADSNSSLDEKVNVIFQTYHAVFDTKPKDRKEALKCVLKIKLENDGFSGYTIDGTGRDADGTMTTKCTDGFVTYSGKAWWVEETCFGRDVGLKTLCEGQFDFEKNIFKGTWKSNEKRHVKYLTLIGRDVTKFV